MPLLEKHPYIDPDVKWVKVSKLRDFTTDTLRANTNTFVIQDDSKPMAVLLTYEKYLAMQEELEAVARTIELLSDNAELEALKKAADDVKAGRVRSLAEIDEEIKKRHG